MQAAFTDANADGTAMVTYQRHAGDGVVHSAYTPYIDRRATIGGVANPYVNTARASIVGLSENITYDVTVTWQEGTGAPSCVAGSVTTFTSTPTSSGSTINVTDDSSLSSALGSVNPGQTISLAAGNYSAFTISRSGSAGSYITITGPALGSPAIIGGSASQNIALNASYVIVKALELGASNASGLVMASSTHDNYIMNLTLDNVDANCATFSGSNPRTDYDYTGIGVGDNASNIFILNNTIHSAALDALSCTCTSGGGCGADTTIYDSPATGINWNNVTTLVVANNTVDGGFRDAITADSSTAVGKNIDISNNTLNDYKDDGAESKGANVNVRLWRNVLTADKGDTCVATNTNDTTNPYGPVYVFRNTCRITTSNPSGETIYKMAGDTPSYVFHNSVDGSPAGVNFDGFNFTSAIIAYNNVMKTKGSVIDYGIGTFDYNLFTTTGGIFVFHWNLVTDYATWALFKSGTSQETHGVNADPSFSDTALHIGPSSPAIDVGVLLQNFNASDSAWPYSGAGPDLGAWER